jgi:hypothetical protein
MQDAANTAKDELSVSNDAIMIEILKQSRTQEGGIASGDLLLDVCAAFQ